MTNIATKDGAALGSRRFNFDCSNAAIRARKKTDNSAERPFFLTRREEEGNNVAHLKQGVGGRMSCSAGGGKQHERYDLFVEAPPEGGCDLVDSSPLFGQAAAFSLICKGNPTPGSAAAQEMLRRERLQVGRMGGHGGGQEDAR